MSTAAVSSSLNPAALTGMSEDHMLALFLLAGIRVDGWTVLPNNYWPDVSEYAHLRKASPWWRVDTGAGPITVGWRKRVLVIDWSETELRGTVTKDDVTKSRSMVHAWDYGKAVEYLTALKRLARLEASQ